jgi:hypothetical protein
METIAFKATWKHAVLEYQIKEIDTNQDLSRSAITNRAIDAAKNVVDWNPVKEKLALLKRLDIPVAVSMQAKPDEECANEIPQIKKKILLDLKDSIERLQTSYFMQLLWMNYLEELKNQATRVGAEQHIRPDDISGPDMVKLLVELILLNRDADAETINNIKTLLVDWRNSR